MQLVYGEGGGGGSSSISLLYSQCMGLVEPSKSELGWGPWLRPPFHYNHGRFSLN